MSSPLHCLTHPLALALLTAAASTAILPASARAQSIATADRAPAELARRHHDAGVGLLAASPPNHDGAMAEFLRAYEMLAGHPRRFYELSNIGRCLQGMGRYAEAATYLRRYLVEGGEAAGNRADIEATLTTLESLLATVTVEGAPDGAEVWLDGAWLGAAPLRRRIAPGRHFVEVRAAGFEPARDEFVLASGDLHAASARLTSLAHPGSHRVWFWAAAGVSAAGLATWGVLGGVTLARGDDLRVRLESPNATTRFGVTEPEVEEVKALALAADVTLGVAVVAGVSALVLGVSTRWRLAPPPVGIGVATARGAASLTVGGSF